MKLFTVGPVEMYPETLEESSVQLPYFRTDEFSEIMKQSEKMLLELSDAPQGSRVVFLTASGTGAMEAAIINLLDKTDHALTVDGGSFGHRFAQMCDCHNIPQTVLHLDFGEVLTGDKLEAAYRSGMTVLLVNLHETSTGQLYDLDMLGAFCKKHGLLLIVDAISAFLADPISMERAGIDALITSSQKAFALAPGISTVTLSPRVIELLPRKGTNLMYFDFTDYLRNGERGQTPFTPAVGTLLTLNSRLKQITSDGLEQVRDAIRSLSEDFRKKVSALPINIPEYPLSNALTPLYFPDGNAMAVYKELRDRYGLTVTPNGGSLANYLLRVGHIGNVTAESIDQLVAALKELLQA